MFRVDASRVKMGVTAGAVGAAGTSPTMNEDSDEAGPVPTELTAETRTETTLVAEAVKEIKADVADVRVAMT
jgi:hypothetical protein